MTLEIPLVRDRCYPMVFVVVVAVVVMSSIIISGAAAAGNGSIIRIIRE